MSDQCERRNLDSIRNKAVLNDRARSNGAVLAYLCVAEKLRKRSDDRVDPNSYTRVYGDRSGLSTVTPSSSRSLAFRDRMTESISASSTRLLTARSSAVSSM